MGEPSEIVGEDNKTHPNSSQKQKTSSIRQGLLGAKLFDRRCLFHKITEGATVFFSWENLALNSQDHQEKALNKSEQVPWDWNIDLHELFEFTIKM